MIKWIGYTQSAKIRWVTIFITAMLLVDLKLVTWTHLVLINKTVSINSNLSTTDANITWNSNDHAETKGTPIEKAYLPWLNAFNILRNFWILNVNISSIKIHRLELTNPLIVFYCEAPSPQGPNCTITPFAFLLTGFESNYEHARWISVIRNLKLYSLE